MFKWKPKTFSKWIIEIFLIIKFYQFPSIFASFKQNFKFAYISAYATRKLVPVFPVIKMLASFSNLIRCFVNDGLILTFLCVIAFLLKYFYSLNEWDLNFMMVLCVLFLSVSQILCSMSVFLVISSLDIPVSLNVTTKSFLNLFKFSFSSLHNPVRAMQGFLE